MDFRNWPKKHPVISALFCFAVISFPQWLQSIWSLFSTDAPLPTIKNWLVMQSLPTFSAYWVTAPLGLGMFCWLIYEIRNQSFISVDRTNFSVDEWLNHDTYFVWAAACLWKEIKPVPHINEHSSAYPILQKIKGALETAKIVSLHGDTGMQAKVKREELIKFALLINDRPKFLFPNDYEAVLNIEDEKAAVWRGYNRKKFQQNGWNKDSALLRLTQLRGEGVVIRNGAESMLFTSQLDVWTRKVTDWMHEVIEALKVVSEADSEWFATLDAVPPARVPIPNLRLGGKTDREMFIAIFCQHDFRLLRLERLLVKYGVAA